MIDELKNSNAEKEESGEYSERLPKYVHAFREVDAIKSL
jgi:hypothetical protein